MLNKHITLKHLLIREKQCIGLQFNSDKVIQALIKELPDSKWSKEFNMVYIINNKSNLNLIFEKFRGVAWVNCNYFFQNRKLNSNNNTVDVAWFRKRPNKQYFRPCPEEFLQKLEIKKYSNSTVKNYVHSFEGFINYYKDRELFSINENDIRLYLHKLIKEEKSKFIY